MIKLQHLPVEGMDMAKITSPYGMRKHPFTEITKLHDGIDYGEPTGTPIYAVADGKVEVSKMQGNGLGWGNYIIIKHDGFWTLCAHLHTRKVYAGGNVKTGQLIGTVGSTGYSTGPHLHFSVYIDIWAKPRKSVDPEPLLAEIGKNMEVEKLRIMIAGKVKIVNAVNVEGNNYVKLRDLTDVIDVGYDVARKLPIVNSKS